MLEFDCRVEIVYVHGASNASFERCRMFIDFAKYLGKEVILHEHAADLVEY